MSWRDLTDMVLDVTEDTFGDESIFTPANGTPENVRGIFERHSNAVDPHSFAQGNLPGTFIDFRIADLSRMPEAGDSVTHESVSYDVVDVNFDGWSMVRCYLGGT